ncbi:GntR family transcriptional regulator [Leucobacter chromiiresistens]|uniref:DNA-binding transcriptional regulator, GntR family n=1 Tax=Leucobacter chromiiresistens TaxID=1079994 RepID=A0A1H1AFS0_9MICO|nr:GntR family transcriptional regulator [Leucobacter chromiiresistens]SDQ38573.1 DNA-binding transcriptional regulator, GntR family [Leucobacter chromiiresistens]
MATATAAKSERTGERVYRALLEQIQTGALAPGTAIGEVEQSLRWGVSRTPMREAIGRLVADGLITQQSARVLVVSGFDVADVRALFETRRALEETAARLAAERGDRQTFAEIASAFETAHPDPTASSADAYYALIARFDEAIDVAVANPYLVQALRPVRTHLARARALARDHHERLVASVGEHALIARAIADGDPELAAHATHVHLHRALASILAAIADTEERASA